MFKQIADALDDPMGSSEGFKIKFKNGWTVSVQWHEGAYSDEENKTAEIAAWHEDDVSYDFGYDTVKGWQTPEEVAEFIKMISMLEGARKLRSASMLDMMIKW